MEIGGELKNDILSKLYRFLTYQERCTQDIKRKLNQLDIPEHYHSDYIQHLVEENYLNEERFCQSFAESKLRSNKWGKKKVLFALRKKGIDSNLIDEVLEGFPKNEYKEIALQLAQKKNRTITTDDQWKRKQRIYNYLAQKGFENEVIRATLEQVLD